MTRSPVGIMKKETLGGVHTRGQTANACEHLESFLRASVYRDIL